MGREEQTAITEFPFQQGQNEGVEAAVLPLPQFAYLQNVRYRKGQRLGKRNGYTALAQTQSSAAAMGNGVGRVNVLGEQFIQVDDRFYQWNETADTWQSAVAPTPINRYGYRAQRVMPQFVPGSSIVPIRPSSAPTPASAALGNVYASLAVFLGYVWVAANYYNTSAARWDVRVTATDPETGAQVYEWDISAAGVTIAPQPTLMAVGARLALFIFFDTGVPGTTGLAYYNTITSLTGQFTTATTLVCAEAAVGPMNGSTTDVLVAYGTAAAQTNVALFNAVTGVLGAPTTTASAAAPDRMSVFGTVGEGVWVGYSAPEFSTLFVRAYTPALVVAGTVDLFPLFNAATDPVGPVYFARRTATTVAVVCHSLGGSGDGVGLGVIDVSTTATTNTPMLQSNCTALSQPFTVGALVYMWAQHEADSQLTVATLLRIPVSTEFSATATPYLKSFPIEATLDDDNMGPGAGVGGQPPETSGGPSVPIPQATALGYSTIFHRISASFGSQNAAKFPTPRTVYFQEEILVSVKHAGSSFFSTPGQPVDVLEKTFVPSAQPFWVTNEGAYEAGFVQAPRVFSAGATAGGALSVGDYNYTVVFEYLDDHGRTELSAPATPRTTSTSGGNLSVRVECSTLELTEKPFIRARIYRTLVNQTVYYLAGLIDASPVTSAIADGSGRFFFDDAQSDATISVNEILYTQIGNELPNDQFPACSWAFVGANRLWLGGLFKKNQAHASKQFISRISPAFCDDDAFRVTMPDDLTGGAFLDAPVFFTREGIYTVSGDGPDVAGEGYFSPPARLPFEIGCINPRSVISVDDGIFFQSARGLYLLPRGLSAPVPAGDVVMETLADFPHILSSTVTCNGQAQATGSLGEHTVQWVCVDNAVTPTATRIIVFDMVSKAWSVDRLQAETALPALVSSWNGQRVFAGPTVSSAIGRQNEAFADGAAAISVVLRTGDIRPWGTLGHGVIHRAGLFGELAAACTLNVTKTTDRGTLATPRVYTGIAPDPLAGDKVYLAVALGQTEQKDVTALRLELSESSTTEGLAFIGLIIEHDTVVQNFRLPSPADRIG